MDYYYATLHFIVTIGVLVWLFVKRPHIYRGARTVLFATTLIGLVGFYSLPARPAPAAASVRLRRHLGEVPHLGLAGRSRRRRALQPVRRDAEPAHRVGAVVRASSLVMCAQPCWVRILGLIYPVFTLMVIVGTANHFVIDAVGGAAVARAGVRVQWLLSGARRVHRRPSTPRTSGCPIPRYRAERHQRHAHARRLPVSHRPVEDRLDDPAGAPRGRGGSRRPPGPDRSPAGSPAPARRATQRRALVRQLVARPCRAPA